MYARLPKVHTAAPELPSVALTGRVVAKSAHRPRRDDRSVVIEDAALIDRKSGNTMTNTRVSSPVPLAVILFAASSSLALGGRAEAQVAEESAVTEASDPYGQGTPLEPRRDEGRLRYGGSVATGFGFVTHQTEELTWHVDAHARIGAQLNDYFALYYQASLLVGVTVINGCFGSSSPCSSDVVLLHTSAAVAELTIANGLQISAGPSVVVGGGDAGAVAGAGITGRLAWTFGGMGTGTRQGFSIAAIPNGGWFLTDGGGGFWDLTFALGWDSF